MAKYELETRCLHSGQETDGQFGSTVCPIYQTASYSHENPQDLEDIFMGKQFGFAYSRIANPSVAYLEQHVNQLEKGRGAIAISSGMAAMTIICEALTRPGDHIVSSNSIFGGTYYLLQEFAENYDVPVSFVEGADISAYEQAITDQTKLISVEVIGNPKLDVPNIKALSNIAKEKQIPLVVDCTATTPYLFDAKSVGIDIVWYSATKWLGGGGRSLAGLIIDCGLDCTTLKSAAVKKMVPQFKQMAFLARCRKLRTNKGAVLAPFNAFLIQMGIETLALRVQKQCENAQELALFLEKNQHVKHVNYPGLQTSAGYQVAKQQFKNGFGGLLTIRLGSKENAFQFIKQLKLCKNVTNVGDLKSIVVHPASTIYRHCSDSEKESVGVFDDLVRISVGVEHIEDIKHDFKQALDAIKGEKK